METFAVTGGCGFLGSNICRHLLEKGKRVLCIDSMITGRRSNVSNLREKNLELIEHDITKPLRVEENVDYVLHFASPASPMDYLKLPVQTLEAGAFGTYNALRLAEEKKAGFLLASSSEVYGDPLIHPQKESYWGNVNPVGPRSVYDEAKRFAEALTTARRRTVGLDARIARIFNTYGPGMRRNDGRVVPAFITQALEGSPLTVFGDGSQTRSFCFVSDLVEGIMKLNYSDCRDPVNLGNPSEISMLEFAKLVIELTGSASGIIFKPLPEDDPRARKPDISLARSKLGWEPKVELREGLEETVAWFRKT